MLEVDVQFPFNGILLGIIAKDPLLLNMQTESRLQQPQNVHGIQGKERADVVHVGN